MGVAVGPAATSSFGPSIAALAVLAGIAIPGLAVLSLVNTRYVLTDRAACVADRRCAPADGGAPCAR